MKTILLFCFMFCSVSMWSQLEINLEINFNAQFGQEYVPLEEFTNLTEGLGAWDYSNMYEYEDYELSTPLIFPGFEDRPMNNADFGAGGGFTIEYYNQPEDPYEIYFYGLALDYFVLSPLNDEENTDQGHILLHESNGLIIFELRNVALEDELDIDNGELVSRINLQIEIHFEDLCVQFNYGPSIISPTMEEYFEEYMPVGVVFGWYYDEFINGDWEEYYLELIGILSGDPNDPQFHQLWVDMDFDEEVEFLTAFPEEGTVYRFCFSETSSTKDQLTEIDNWSLYPNPATDQITIILSELGATTSNEYRIQLMDVHGKVVMEKEIGSDQTISIESLPAGLYFASLKGGNFFEVHKVVKQ